MLTRVIETACGPVEYTEVGAGEPVLYFHGAGVTGDAMVSVESSLVDDGFRLIVPNRPGYGRTPLGPHRSAADCARVAAALLDALGVPRAGMMGSSGGAMFAASFAIRHPDRAASLTLLCPQLHRWDERRWLPATSRWTLPLLTRRLWRKLLLALYRIQLRRMTPQQLLRIEAGEQYPDVAGDPAALRLAEQTLAAMRRGVTLPGFENDFLVFASEDVAGPSDSLDVPTFIIHDAADPLAPAEHVHWFASRFPRCEVLAVRAAGHLVWAGREADAVRQARAQFLRQHPAD